MVHLFIYQKFHFEYILEGFGMENVGIFCGHLAYFTAIWYILGPFVFLWSFDVSFPFWYVFASKILQP
jgi:hypothetical protein